MYEGFRLLSDDLSPHLQRTFRRNGLHVLRQFRVGADVSHLIDVRAAHYARDRAGRLIKDFAKSTPEMLRETVAHAIEERWSANRLASELRDSAFSPRRALNISRTELQEAHRSGAREAAGIAGAQEKHWDSDVDACQLCRDNSDQGWISIDDNYENGDSPHPSCVCSEEYRMRNE